MASDLPQATSSSVNARPSSGLTVGVNPPASITERLNSAEDVKEILPIILADLQGRSPSVEVALGLENALLNDLQQISIDCPRVCFLGKTGSGKTSLMNAILGQDLLPAEDSGVAVTSAVTEIRNDPSLAEGQIVIALALCSREEWVEKKRLLIGALAGDHEDSGSFAEEEMQDLARTILSVSCAGKRPEDVQPDTPESEEFLHKYLASGPRQRQTFHSISEVKAWLGNRVHLAQSGDKIEAILTSTVSISGNFPRIPRDVTLVDLPGLEDSNLLRSSVSERYFSLFCTHAWFCLPRSEGRILSNSGIARQIRTLARGGTLGNVLVIRTRADEAPRKTATVLGREFEQFQRLCNQEMQALHDGRPPLLSETAPNHAGTEDIEPPRSRRRTMDGDETRDVIHHFQAGVSFAGYVLATAAPAVDDMPAVIAIDTVIEKLQGVGKTQRDRVKEMVHEVYQTLGRLLAQVAEEACCRAEEEQRAREEQELQRRQLEAEQAQREAEAEQQRRLMEERQRLEELERQERVRDSVQQRVQQVAKFHAALDECQAKVSQFKASLCALSGGDVSAALLSELRRAKPPNGKTLQALVSSGGVYTSPTRGSFDLIDTFSASMRVSGRDLPSAFAQLLEIVNSQLRASSVPVNINQVMALHERSARQQINAVTTRGGPIHLTLNHALTWQGGKGASDNCIRAAERVLASRVAPTIQQIAQTLAGAMEMYLRAVKEGVSNRIGIFERPSQGPHQGERQCIICQAAPAVGRARFVVCRCSPQPPYACAQCIPSIELQYRHCPMCRQASS